MNKVALLLLLLVIPITSKITLSCRYCSSGYCIKVDGGPFDDYQEQITTSCYQAGFSQPLTIQFNCNKDCSGCEIQVTKGGQTGYSCTELEYSFMRTMNQLYGLSKGNPSLTYDRCPTVCLSTLTIILICAAGIAVIAAIVKYCMRRNKLKRQAQFQGGTRQQFIRNIQQSLIRQLPIISMTKIQSNNSDRSNISQIKHKLDIKHIHNLSAALQRPVDQLAALWEKLVLLRIKSQINPEQAISTFNQGRIYIFLSKMRANQTTNILLLLDRASQFIRS